MKKILCVFAVLLLLTGCSYSTSKELEELEKIVENTNFSDLKTNKEINEIYNNIESINGSNSEFLKKKEEIINNLKLQAIEVWEEEIIKAIENKQWNNYFDFRESLVFKDYYYWFSDENYYFNKENIGDFILENKFLSCYNLYSSIQVGNNAFEVADEKFEEIYTLTQYLSLYSFSKTIYPNNPPYSDFAIETWEYDLSKINPDYSGKMSNEIRTFALEIFGSEEEWRNKYEKPQFYWTGNIEHYYFLPLNEIQNNQIEKFGKEKVEELKQNEIDKAETDYQYYMERKENENKGGNNSVNQQQISKDGFTLNNSKIVTDKKILAKCWTVATEEVKRNLKSPSSAKFPFSAISDGVEILQDRNYYCVHGWVEAKNSYGNMIKSDFIVLIEEKSGNFIVYDCAIE